MESLQWNHRCAISIRHPGGTQEASGRHLGGIWEVSGRHLEARGPREAPRGSGKPKVLFCMVKTAIFAKSREQVLTLLCVFKDDHQQVMISLEVLKMGTCFA